MRSWQSFFAFVILSILQNVQAFSQRFDAISIQDAVYPELEYIEAYTVYEWDGASFYSFIQGAAQPVHFELAFDDRVVPVCITQNDGFQSEARIKLLTQNGVISKRINRPLAHSGFVRDMEMGSIRLITTPEYIGGQVAAGGRTWMIEPMFHHIPDAPKNLILVYAADNLIVPPGLTCGNDHFSSVIEATSVVEPDQMMSTGCKEIEYILAADWLFYNKYGTEYHTIARIDLIMNLVQGQYSGVFNNEYLFTILEYQISTCSTCDPPEWTNTVNPLELITNFGNWGENGGFANSIYDVGGLWTGRTLQTPIIGVAYIEGICNTTKYHCLSDFNPSSSLMRAMVSHEFGHNFSSDHDPTSGFIMSPTVGNTTQWSGQSKTAINQYTTQLQCLANCQIYPPPVSWFSGAPLSGCAPLVVQFEDLSSNDPVEWNWTFTGGTPATSQDQHPIVTYTHYGEFPVSLSVSNAHGSNSYTRIGLVNVNETPSVSFDYIVDSLTVYFMNNSHRASSCLWTFGDGTTSTEKDPVHIYKKDSFYIVTLQGENECGIEENSQVLSVWTMPKAGFKADTLFSCDSIFVHYSDTSSRNVTGWKWFFPGGTPDSSMIQHPVVRYDTAGYYDVMLIVTNPAGRDTIQRKGYFHLMTRPDTVFQWLVSVDSLYVNYSGVVDSLKWDFGDGFTADSSFAVHQYEKEGYYLVKLTTYSPCGVYQIGQIVRIVYAPVAACIFNPDQGCHPLSVTYVSLASLNTDSILWEFPGGTPSFAVDSIVNVIYSSAGIYNFTMVAVNSSGKDTLVHNGAVVVGDSLHAIMELDINGSEVMGTSMTANAEEYIWDMGDGTLIIGDVVQHSYAGDGEFLIRHIVSNVCNSDTVSMLVTIQTTGTIDPTVLAGIRLWPNPAEEILYITGVKDDVELIEWRIHSGSGIQVQTGRFEQGFNSYGIPLTSFSSGLYFLSVKDIHGRWLGLKFLIQKD